MTVDSIHELLSFEAIPDFIVKDNLSITRIVVVKDLGKICENSLDSSDAE